MRCVLAINAGGLMLVNPVYLHGINLFVRPLTATSRPERVPGLGAELLNADAAALEMGGSRLDPGLTLGYCCGSQPDVGGVEELTERG